MKSPSSSNDHSVRQSLQQHEFDFDPTAWDAMRQKLDQRDSPSQGLEHGGTSYLMNTLHLGWIAMGLVLVLTLAWWQWPSSDSLQGRKSTTLPTSLPAMSETSTITTPSNTATAPTITSNNTSNNINELQTTKLGTSPSVKTPAANKKTNAKATNDVQGPSNTLSSTKPSSSPEGSSSKSIILSSEISDTAQEGIEPQGQDKTDRQAKSRSINSSAPSAFSKPNSITPSGFQPSSSEPINTKTKNEISNTDKYSSSSSAQASNRTGQKGLSQPGTLSSKQDRKSSPLGRLTSRSTETLMAPLARPSIRQMASLESNLEKMDRTWYWGVKAGLYSSQTYVNNKEIRIPRGNNSPDQNLYFGTFIGYRLNPYFSIESGLGYTSIKHHFSFTPLLDSGERYRSGGGTKFHQWDFPLRTQFHISNRFKVNIGGGLSIRRYGRSFTARAFGSSRSNPNYEEVRNKFFQTVKRFDTTLAYWEFGLGYTRNHWSLDLTTRQFFGKVLSSGSNPTIEDPYPSAESAVSLTLGYRFQKLANIKAAPFAPTATNLPPHGEGWYWGLGAATGFHNYELILGNVRLPDFGQGPADYYVFSKYPSNPFALNAFVNYDFPKALRLQLGLEWQRNLLGYSFVVQSDLQSITELGKMRVSTIDIPLRLNYRVFRKVRLVAGVGLQFNRASLAIPLVEFPNHPDAAEAFRQFPRRYPQQQGTWEIGAGIDHRRLSVDLRLRQQLTRPDNSILYTRQILFSVQYLLGRL